MKTDDNSFEEYKKYLQKSLGITSLPAPQPPMNPYMRFYLQRSSEERAKGSTNWNELARTLAIEWRTLPANKKEYYEKLHSIRTRERRALMQEYLKLSGKQKILSPYSRFVKKRYAQYEKEYTNFTSVQINKLIKNDWRAMGQKQKAKLTDQYEKEKNDATLDIDNSDRIAEYTQRLEKYHQQIKEDKEKIQKKYGFSKESKAKLKREEREQERLKRRALRQLQRQQRNREKQEEKKKLREARLKKLREDREAQKKLKEQQKQREKEAKLKAKAEEAERKKKEAENDKKQKKTVKPEVKIEEKKSKSKSKPKVAQKVEAKKPQAKKTQAKKTQKTKKIKKAKETKKEKKATKAKASKTKSKAKAKPAAKAKGKAKKAKPAKGGRRGRK